ncbi:MAG: class I SAM-dependent methyltransferase [bacterium]
MNNHIKLFDKIAFIYQWFFKLQVKSYQKIIKEYDNYLNISQGDEVLDLGCGTGAFTYALQEKGYNVTGIDASQAMVEQCCNNNVNCIQGNIINGIDFPDSSFDLVTAAYLAHGIDKANRYKLYKEAKRLTNNRVIFHDYQQKDHLIFYLINIIEHLEGGDYFSFRKSAISEMKEIFNEVKIIEVAGWINWYICN